MKSFKDKLENTEFGHLKSDRAVDRHFFLNKNLDDSLLQIKAITDTDPTFRNITVSRLINLFIMESIDNLNDMGVNEAFQHIRDLNTEFENL